MGIRAYSTILAGTHPGLLKRHADILEMRFGLGLKTKQIVELTGQRKSQVNNIIRKYKPKQTGRDLVLTISSKI